MKAEARQAFATAPVIVVGVQSAIAALAVIFAYREVLPSLVLEWYEHENFSYGFLIPLIFAYLVWDKRAQLAQLATTSSPWGIASLGVALLLGFLGQIASEPFVSRVSFVLVLGSLVHLFWGWTAVRRLSFPLGYLFLIIPPPYPIVKAISYHLKMFDAWMAAILLPLAGVPIYRDAYLLHLPNVTLEVADICSGIASLFAMGALGILYAYYLPVNGPGKLMLLLGALFLPVIANLFRIFLVGASVYYYGPVMLRAFFHAFTGTFTFLLSLLMLLAWGEWIRRLEVFSGEGIKTRRFRNDAESTPHRPAVSRQAPWFSMPFIGVLGLVAATLLLSEWTRGAANQIALPDLEPIARRLGNSDAISDKPAEPYRDPYAETVVSRVYRSQQNDIELFVGYRARQFGIERLRSPKLVFPEGWEYASLGPVDIPLASGRSIDAIWVETRKGAARNLVLFWYQVRGSLLASDLSNRLELLRGLLFHGRTDGAVIRLSTPVRDPESLEQAKRRLLSFSASLQPELNRVLPN
jgi:EpsI family protein